jgi:Zn finger protein HypA/HybF involved in hydrogenase expression
VLVATMRLRDVLDRHQLLLVNCNDCDASTPLDPVRFALELGTQAELESLAHGMVCPVCGSADIELDVHSPVAAERETPIYAK